jgi:hypothetical protein
VTSCLLCGGPCSWSWRSARARALVEAWELRYQLIDPLRPLPKWFPWEPLERIVRSRVQPWTDSTGHVHPARDVDIGAEIGLSRRQVVQYRRAGRISEPLADRCAIALGLDPCHIWTDYYTEVAA